MCQMLGSHVLGGSYGWGGVVVRPCRAAESKGRKTSILNKNKLDFFAFRKFRIIGTKLDSVSNCDF